MRATDPHQKLSLQILVKLASQNGSVRRVFYCLIFFSFRTIRPEHVVRSVYKATGCTDNPNHVIYLEHVVVRITITHPRRGDLSINLTSPSGTKSQLLANRYMLATGATHSAELHLFALESFPLGRLYVQVV